MKNKKKILIVSFLILIILISIVGTIIFKTLKRKPEPEPKPEQNVETEENVLVIGLDNTIKEEPEPEPEPEPEGPSTPAEWTTSIEAMGTEIGNLYIPRTKLNTPVYCKQSPEKMEKMPCFLYTSGGLNKPGVTCITGHNRRNRKTIF